MVALFKKHNPQWESVTVIMADKYLTEHMVLAEQFPSAQLLICLFHTLRSLRREITQEKMGITAGKRIYCLEILQEMAYAKDTDEYMELYNDFQRKAPSLVFDYFNEQWHSIRHQWALGAKCAAGNCFSNANNRIESINAKLKSLISKYSSLEEFVDNLFLIINIFRRERNHKAAYFSQKVPTSSIAAADPHVSHYIKHLTPCAFRFVQTQYEFKKCVAVILHEKDSVCFDLKTLDRSEHIYKNVATTSSCNFWLSMRLPCCHIYLCERVLECIFLKRSSSMDTNVATHCFVLKVPKCHQQVSLRFLQRKTAKCCHRYIKCIVKFSFL